MILVVGGGPAGSLSSLLLSKKGYDVVLAEEHQLPGFPMHCAGLISKRCYESYSKYVKISKCTDKKIEGAFFISPSGFKIEAKGEALVVDRKIFDRMLFEKAAENVDTVVKTKVGFSGSKVILNEREIDTEYIVGADGVYSVVARSFGFERPKIYTALQIEAKYEPLDEKFVEVYFGRNFSDFFAYTIPLEGTAKLGVICKIKALEKLRNFMKHLGVESFLEFNVGSIPANLVNFVKGKVVLIGDSAGMVKPYTGGGLYYLLIAAEKLYENFPNLKAFRRDYLKKMWLDFKVGHFIRKFYSMQDEDIDELFKVLKDFDLSGIDMDRPSTAFRKSYLIFKKPYIFFKLFKLIIKAIF